MKKIASLDALVAVLVLGAGAAAQAFPAKVLLRNEHWQQHVEPETGTAVPGFCTAEVTVVDGDQFVRALSNLEQLAAINEWPEGTGLFFIEREEAPAVEEVPVAAPAPLALETPPADTPPAGDTPPAPPADTPPADAPVSTAAKTAAKTTKK